MQGITKILMHVYHNGVVHSADISLAICQQTQIDECLVWWIGQGLP